MVFKGFTSFDANGATVSDGGLASVSSRCHVYSERAGNFVRCTIHAGSIMQSIFYVKLVVTYCYRRRQLKVILEIFLAALLSLDAFESATIKGSACHPHRQNVKAYSQQRVRCAPLEHLPPPHKF